MLSSEQLVALASINKAGPYKCSISNVYDDKPRALEAAHPMLGALVALGLLSKKLVVHGWKSNTVYALKITEEGKSIVDSCSPLDWAHALVDIGNYTEALLHVKKLKAHELSEFLVHKEAMVRFAAERRAVKLKLHKGVL